MAAPVVKGFDGFTEQSSQKRTVQGETKRVRIWLGPASKLDAFLQSVLDLEPPPESVVSEDGVPSRIEAVFPLTSASEGDPETEAEDASVWESIPERLEKPLALNGYFHISGTSKAVIEECDEAIRQGTARATNWTTLHGAVYQSYVNHRLLGMDTFILFSYMIRKTVQFNSSVPMLLEYSTAPSSPSIPSTVITWDTLDTLIPDRAKFEQPKVHIWPLNLNRARGFADIALDEWLVMAPSLTWQKGKKIWTLTREWLGAETWSGVLYDGGTFFP